MVQAASSVADIAAHLSLFYHHQLFSTISQNELKIVLSVAETCGDATARDDLRDSTTRAAGHARVTDTLYMLIQQF